MGYAERQAKLYESLKRGGDTKKLYQALYHEKTESFVMFVDRYLEEHGLKRQYVILKAQIQTQYGYKILSGQKHTKDRDLILRLCIAMGMTVDETQKAIKYYGMPMLDHDTCRDEIILIGIDKKHDLYTIEEWLRLNSLEPLVK